MVYLFLSYNYSKPFYSDISAKNQPKQHKTVNKKNSRLKFKISLRGAFSHHYDYLCAKFHGCTETDLNEARFLVRRRGVFFVMITLFMDLSLEQGQISGSTLGRLFSADNPVYGLKSGTMSGFWFDAGASFVL
ncbi:hypothetical protein AVEN_256720-1 [Araneus ventricosus]|uniref:Uncharacterized protein n=1 Tax=Araneus ventricosus TaxID=182803 RepID=A0A4Y2W1R8_ARAVE|nr:hypothetical protein AVEN_101584-1 [Araneus ventricosus]GBO30505.1 hypothetical protein AVEN_256720-1 [Araneus ventricosus]